MLTVKATCTGCGAPLAIIDGMRHVICAYCSASLRVEPAAPAHAGPSVPAWSVSPEGVPAEEIERVKQLVLAGQRDEAIAHYARAAGVSPAEAEKTLDQLVTVDVMKLLRQLPLNAFGFLAGGVLLTVWSAVGAWSVTRVLDGAYGFAALTAGCVLVLVWQVRWLTPKIVSTFVYRFGAEGRARVVRRAVLQRGFRGGDGTLALVLFEVTPAAGGAPFLDEEVLFVGAATFEALSPGHVVRVRFDEPARRRVFPVTPVVVVAQA